MKYADLTWGRMEAIVNKLGGMEGVERFLRGDLVVSELFQLIAILSVTIDYDLTLTDMIKAGEYGWFNRNITAENFPISGKGKVETNVHLFCLNESIKIDEDIPAKIDKLGFRPAKIEELLALGAKMKNVFYRNFTIALGSAWQVGGDREFPYLEHGSCSYSLNLARLNWYPGDLLSTDLCFAAVRK